MKEQIEKYFQQELTHEERLELLREVEADPLLRDEFTTCQNTYALLSFSDEVIDREESIQGYTSFKHNIKKHNIRRLILKSARYAAAVSLIVVVVHLFHVYYYPSNMAFVPETSLFVPAGQRVSITLGDGTLVWLNAQTRLTYPTVFVGQERRVSVEGEAYFDVAEDKDKPFIVSSGKIEMEVLGTEFNVYSYPEERVSRISLVEGSLRVHNPESASEEIILRPNEEVLISEDRMLVSNIQNKDYFLWKEGLYSFDSETFENILKKLELYYDIDIVVKDPALLQWEYTVKFRQRDGIEEILRLMQRIHKFKMVKDENNNRITISR